MLFYVHIGWLFGARIIPHPIPRYLINRGAGLATGG
jgi:hypothetical protein